MVSLSLSLGAFKQPADQLLTVLLRSVTGGKDNDLAPLIQMSIIIPPYSPDRLKMTGARRI